MRLLACVGISTGDCALGRIDSGVARLASRIAEVTAAGQILFSIGAEKTINTEAIWPSSWETVGTVFLGDVIRRERVFQLLDPQLEMVLPAPALDDAVVNMAPKGLGFFIGRDDEADALASLIEVTRVVNVVGPRGIGKTHFVARAASEFIESWADGIVWINLSDVTSLETLRLAIVNALQLRDLEPDTVEDELLWLLKDRSYLVVFDGVDHCATQIVGFVERILRVPGPRIILTSRRRVPLPVTASILLPRLSLPPWENSFCLPSLKTSRPPPSCWTKPGLLTTFSRIKRSICYVRPAIRQMEILKPSD